MDISPGVADVELPPVAHSREPDFNDHATALQLRSLDGPDAVDALIGDASQQRPTAQKAVIRQVYGRVHHLVKSLCGTELEVEDVTHQALLEVLCSAESFRGGSSLERWVDRITIRCVQRAMRKEGRRKRLLERWLVPNRMPWGSLATVVGQEPMRLNEVLDRLPLKRREVMILHHGLGYSVDEMSELLGTPSGTIKHRLVAGRKQLRRWLREWSTEPS